MRRYQIGLRAAGVLALSMAASALLPDVGFGQAAGMVGVGSTQTITARATVAAVDPAARTVTLVGVAGNRFTLAVGPQVVNLDRLKEGDSVVARYQESIAYVLSPPNAGLPETGLTVTGEGAAKGEEPSGTVQSKLVVTGLVVAVDPAGRTLQLVDPGGGAVTTVHVSSQDAADHLGQIKVGDTITAVVTQALAVAIEPAL